MAKERKEVLMGKTRRTKTGCGNLYVTINFENDQPAEVFVRLGKAGGCAASHTEAIGRLISISLRAGVPISDIATQLLGIGCHMPIHIGMGRRNLSCADAVAHCIRYLCNIDDPAPDCGATEEA